MSVEGADGPSVGWVLEGAYIQGEVAINEAVGTGGGGDHTLDSEDLSAGGVSEERAGEVGVGGEEEIGAGGGGQIKSAWEVQVEPRRGGDLGGELNHEVVRGGGAD